MYNLQQNPPGPCHSITIPHCVNDILQYITGMPNNISIPHSIPTLPFLPPADKPITSWAGSQTLLGIQMAVRTLTTTTDPQRNMPGTQSSAPRTHSSTTQQQSPVGSTPSTGYKYATSQATTAPAPKKQCKGTKPATEDSSV